MILLLGIHLEASYVDICVLESETRRIITTVRYPETHDDQKPSAGQWWRNLCLAISDANSSDLYDPDDIMAIGIVSSAAGIVLVDKNNALPKNAFIQSIDLTRIKVKEPKRYSEIHKILLPVDFIAWKLTGEVGTIPWPDSVLTHDRLIEKKFLPPIKENFGIHGYLKNSMAERFGFGKGIPVSYKSCDAADVLNESNAARAAAIGAGIGVHIIKRYQKDKQL